MSYAVLVVEDELTLARNIAQFLGRHGYEVRTAASAEHALEEMEAFRPEAVVLDFDLPGMKGLELLQLLRRRDPQIKVIMATGHGNEQVAVDAMKAGAVDYFTKPLALGKLKLVLDKVAREAQRDGELTYFREREAGESGLARLVGESTAMRAVKELITRLLDAERALVDSDLPAVLITGATGSGKELVARALHFDGARRDKPFVEVNCSSIPAQLLEAELFGFERGAFTDARQRKLGLIESAAGGTLFLDEIGEMDLSLQAKLLRFLEEKTVRRLGSVREQKVNVRVIAATNRDLDQRISDGKFRADLLFRLRILQIELPPVAARPGDVRLLVEHFLRKQGARYGKASLQLSAAALQLLESYAWPGNVRELRNVIERSVILARGNVIEAADLNLARGAGPSVVEESAVPLTTDRMSLVEVERQALKHALEQAEWNVSRAAKLLGVSRDTMRYRIEKHQLKLPS